jgi:uncharacterized membrane-anchored protein
VYKLPKVNSYFWIMKISATTLGETAGDLLSMTLALGYALSAGIFFGLLVIFLVAQMTSKNYRPLIYWMVILLTATTGTAVSDFIDRTLGIGYVEGSIILTAILVVVLAAWYLSGRSLAVEKIRSHTAEAFYWTAILVSNTLGTALGDFLSTSSGLGFVGANLLITGGLLLVLLATYFTKISRVPLFWIAFVLTRPFGATFGDVLTKSPADGGTGFGTIGSSLIIGAILVIFMIYTTLNREKVVEPETTGDPALR